MLGVVQQVAKDIGDVEVGTLATFDHMFAGIRASLKSAAQRSIDVAERNLDNQLAIRLLKALFLVKYVESFQATPRNLTVLVYDRFGLDLPALVGGGQGGADAAGDADLRPAQRQRLRVPDQRRAGHRGGDQERRHRRLRGQRPALQDPLRRRHQDQQDPLRQERPGLPVRLQARRPGPRPAEGTLGPLHHPGVPVHAGGDPDAQRGQGRAARHPRTRRARARRTCACCIKTEKYTKRKQTTSLSAIEEQILRSKAAQNGEREKELVERIQTRGGQGRAGHQRRRRALDLAGRARPRDRRLPGTRQPHLHPAQAARRRHLQRAAGRRCCQPRQRPVRRRRAARSSTAPAEEVLSFILRKDGLGEQVTVKTIVDTFQAKPYGWDLASIEVIVASLIGASKVTLTVDGNVLKRSEVAAALRNTQKHSHAVVAPQKTFDERKVASLPQVLHRLLRRGQRARRIRWSWPATAPTSSRASSTNSRRRSPARSTRSSSSSAAPSRCWSRSSASPTTGTSTDFNLGDDLLEAKENLIDPIQSFLNGAQRSIYDEAVDAARDPQQQPRLPARRAATRRSRLRSPTPTPSAATRWRSSSRPPTTCAARSTTSSPTNRATVDRGDRGPQGRAARQRLLREGHGGGAAARRRSGSTRRSPESRTESQVALILQIGSNFEASDYPALLDLLAASPAEASDDPARRSRRSRSRRSRCPAPPASSRPRRTSTSTSPPCAARSSRP